MSEQAMNLLSALRAILERGSTRDAGDMSARANMAGCAIVEISYGERARHCRDWCSVQGDTTERKCMEGASSIVECVEREFNPFPVFLLILSDSKRDLRTSLTAL
jgi:hypothetical protein